MASIVQRVTDDGILVCILNWWLLLAVIISDDDLWLTPRNYNIGQSWGLMMINAWGMVGLGWAPQLSQWWYQLQRIEHGACSTMAIGHSH